MERLGPGSIFQIPYTSQIQINENEISQNS